MVVVVVVEEWLLTVLLISTSDQRHTDLLGNYSIIIIHYCIEEGLGVIHSQFPDIVKLVDSNNYKFLFNTLSTLL